MAATDFFTTEVWTARGLIRYHILFVIRLASREVKIVGIVPEPDGVWMKQIARNMTDCIDGFLKGCKYLIHDRSPLFSAEFKRILKGGGVNTIKLPRRSPNLNCYAERWVRTAKELCVELMIFFGEESLRKAMYEVEIFYNSERPHQGLENKLIKPKIEVIRKDGSIGCRNRLGGLMKYYYRKAA